MTAAFGVSPLADSCSKPRAILSGDTLTASSELASTSGGIQAGIHPAEASVKTPATPAMVGAVPWQGNRIGFLHGGVQLGASISCLLHLQWLRAI